MKIFILAMSLLASAIVVQGDDILVDATADEIVETITRHQGEKPVLVNFWATWCAPCIEEFPHLMELRKKYYDQFELILVSGDFPEARDEALEFLKKQGVDFKTYFKVGKDNEFISTISGEWSGALPFTIVYNKEGDVSAVWEGKADKETFESKLLNVISEE